MGGGKRTTYEGVLQWVAPYDQEYYGMQREFSISLASRSERLELGETNGVEYWFNIPLEKFVELRDKGELLEFIEHPGGFYATPIPRPDVPMLYEIEVVGVCNALHNEHPNARRIRESNVAIYIAQSSMAQLLDQILARPDGMTEKKKLERAARYPGEMSHMLKSGIPFAVIENRPGAIEATRAAAIQVVAGDPDAPTLDIQTIRDRIEEACDHMRDNNIEPILELV
jgi:guanylate kinase